VVTNTGDITKLVFTGLPKKDHHQQTKLKHQDECFKYVYSS